MIELFANSGDPDQTPRSVASDQGLYCLPITLLGISRLQWVKTFYDLSINYFRVCYEGHLLLCSFNDKRYVY